LFFGVVDGVFAGPVQRDAVQGGEDALLGRGQPARLPPLEGDEQVDAPGRVEPGRVDRG
jgi:hypothetical protein